MLIIAILLSFSCSSFSSVNACIKEYKTRLYNLENNPPEENLPQERQASKKKILDNLQDDINILKSCEEVAKNIKENFPNLIGKNGNCPSVKELYKKLKDIIDIYKINRNFENHDKIGEIILDLDIEAKKIGNNASEIRVQLEQYQKQLPKKEDNKSEEQQDVDPKSDKSKDDSKTEKDKKPGQGYQSEPTVETTYVAKLNVSATNQTSPTNQTSSVNSINPTNDNEEEKQWKNTPSQDTSSSNNIQIPKKMEEDLEKLARKYQGFDLKYELSPAEEIVFKNRLSSIPFKVYPVIKIKRDKDNGNNIYRILIRTNESTSEQPFKKYDIEK